MYRIFHPMDMGYTFFSAAHGIVSKIGYMLGYKANLNSNKQNNALHLIN